MSKNPYEIRADILEMTKDYMDEQVKTNIRYAEMMTELGKQIDPGKFFNSYTAEELIEQAKRFYSFVETSR